MNNQIDHTPTVVDAAQAMQYLPELGTTDPDRAAEELEIRRGATEIGRLAFISQAYIDGQGILFAGKVDKAVRSQRHGNVVSFADAQERRQERDRMRKMPRQR